MRLINFKLLRLIIATTMLFLTACGGGSNSGGSQELSGIFTGTGTIVFNGGGSTSTSTGGFTITINPNGSVAYKEEGVTRGTSTLNQNQFTIILQGSQFNAPELDCIGTFELEGTVTGNIIKGDISGSTVRCNGAAISISGTFSGSRIS